MNNVYKVKTVRKGFYRIFDTRTWRLVTDYRGERKNAVSLAKKLDQANARHLVYATTGHFPSPE